MNALQVVARRAVQPFAGYAASSSRADMTFGEALALMAQGSLFGGDMLRGHEEDPSISLAGMAAVYGRSSIAFASLQARWKLLSQVRFQFQQLFGGRTGALFGTPDLTVLERPEPGHTTIDLAFRAGQDADLAGDWFGVRRTIGGTDRIKRLVPDWTTIVLGSRNPNADPANLAMDPDAEIIGYGYQMGGPGSGSEIIAFGADEVAHFHPNPNPLSRYRGLPLILSAMPEILADNAATTHKRAFFANAATPQLAITFPATMDETKAKEWIQVFERKNRGALNAFKAMYMGGGMTWQSVGSNFRDMTFKELQGTAETRLAAVVGINPVIIPFSEGLAGSALTTGNFAAAARATADVTLRYLWANLCGALERVVPPRPNTRLWYDEKAIPFLQADVKDNAAVMLSNQQAITGYVKEGFTPPSAVDAVSTGDLNRLRHTGLVSVQLQEPGNQLPAAYRVHTDFTPSSGPLSAIGPLAKGLVLSADHPVVTAFPSLVEAVAPTPALASDLAAQALRLRADGLPVAAIAKQLDRTERHVRRLMTEAMS